MTEKTPVRTLSQAGLTLSVSLLLLFLCATAVFCPMVWRFNTQAGPYQPWSPAAGWIYVGARAAQLVLALVLCNLVRKKKHAALETCGPLRKKALTVALAAFAVCALLDALWVLDKAYFIIADRIGVTDWPLFPAVLWEEIFYGDFGWMLLIGSVILLLPGMERKKLALWETAAVAVMIFVRFML